MSDHQCHERARLWLVGVFVSFLSQGLSTVGVGDLVRDEVKQGTVVGKQLKVCI